MIKSLQEVSLLDILPPVIAQDERLRAAAQALDEELHRLAADSRLVLHLPRLNELPHSVLDLLANSYHVDFFEPTEMSRETKIKLIEDSLLAHRIKGTPQAVENLLNKITTGATVEEWFDYGGKPYYFRVNLRGLLDYGDEGETFIRMVEATKNARSWLDAILFDLSKNHPDTILNVAQLQLQQGDIFFDINNRAKIYQPLHIVQSELTRGSQRFDLSFTDKKSAQKLNVGAVELIHGRIRFDADIERVDEYTLIDFERYFRARWLKFKDNPVVEYYSHNEHESWLDGEIDDGEEFFPVEEDFLRIYWGFDKGEDKFHVRYQTILTPRQDISGSEIRALSQIGTSGKILLHSKNKIPTTGILSALYIKKKITTII